MYVSRVHLTDIRCFADLDLRFDVSGSAVPWNVIVGDNATGKTALLRSIALGLCDESSAAGLMKESEEGYIRRDKKRGEILINLVDRTNGKKRYTITTTIQRTSRGDLTFENLSQSVSSARTFPWDRIFVCAYGAGRGTSGTGDIAGWSVVNAVYNLFNYSEGLQNPELIIHRLRRKNTALSTLGKILLCNPKALHMKKSGILANGPWGDDMPLRDLADGYRSSFLWITDMLGWAYAKTADLSSPKDIAGVVLIDELEQHLHATLQRKIVHRLRHAFPQIQFIVTTHSPLIASAIGPVSAAVTDVGNKKEARDRLVYLELQEGNEVTLDYLPSMRLRRVDQVLASRAFKFLIDEDPSVELVLREASILAAKQERSPAEQRRYNRLRKALEPILLPEGQTLIERQIESERYHEILNGLRQINKELRSGK